VGKTSLKKRVPAIAHSRTIHRLNRLSSELEQVEKTTDAPFRLVPNFSIPETPATALRLAGLPIDRPVSERGFRLEADR